MRKIKVKRMVMGKIEAKLKNLERIAEYYEFPMAVFFMGTFNPKEKTRNESVLERIKKFKKQVAELCEEVLE
jgi:hypothetical protein